MTTKLEKVTAYRLITMDHHAFFDHMIAVSWEINVISPIPQVLFTRNVTGWWLITWGNQSQNYITVSKKRFPFTYLYFHPNNVSLISRRVSLASRIGVCNSSTSKSICAFTGNSWQPSTAEFCFIILIL